MHASSCTLSSPSITLLFIRLINKACYPRYALIGWKVDWHGIGDRYFNHVRARTRSCRDGEKERRKDRDKKSVTGTNSWPRKEKERKKKNEFFPRIPPVNSIDSGSPRLTLKLNFRGIIFRTEPTIIRSPSSRLFTPRISRVNDEYRYASGEGYSLRWDV